MLTLFRKFSSLIVSALFAGVLITAVMGCDTKRIAEPDPAPPDTTQQGKDVLGGLLDF